MGLWKFAPRTEHKFSPLPQNLSGFVKNFTHMQHKFSQLSKFVWVYEKLHPICSINFLHFQNFLGNKGSLPLFKKHLPSWWPWRMRLQSGSVRRKPRGPTPPMMSNILSLSSRLLGLRGISCDCEIMRIILKSIWLHLDPQNLAITLLFFIQFQNNNQHWISLRFSASSDVHYAA